MNNDFFEEMRDILNPDAGTEDGSGSNKGAVYGNYIEWPSLEDLNDDQLNQLADYFDIDQNKYDENEFLELLRENGVPEGTIYENDPDFPDSEKYYK